MAEAVIIPPHIAHHARRVPEKPAVIMAESGAALSFEELDRRSTRAAIGLYEMGLRAQDGVAALLENGFAFFELAWATQRSGLYFTPISTHLQIDEISYIIEDSGARAFFVDERLLARLPGLLSALPSTTHCFVVGADRDNASSDADATSSRSGPTVPIDDYDDWLQSMRASNFARYDHFDDMAIGPMGQSLLYSSGTTGRPKGVRRPFSNERADAHTPRHTQMRERYGFNPLMRYLNPAPLYHAAPYGFNMMTIAGGGTTVVMQRFDAEASLRHIESYRITHSQWVPTMFIRMLKLDSERRQLYDLTSHEVAIHAAAPCPVPVKSSMIDWWGPIIHEYYAGSEGIGSTHIDSHQWQSRPGSVGRPSTGRIHILDEHGRELGPGEVGNIYFSGGPTFEYHNAPEKTREAYDERGWATLGDIGYLDEDGFLFLTDRKAHMIISGGVNIYPQETENVLVEHPAVLDAAVIGVPNPDFGEEVKAVCQLVDSRLANEEMARELIDFCRARVSHIKCPRSVDFVDSLPRLPNGKLYKRQLRDQYWPD
jgi:acyl-CoA synthetase (AMP-forming)/AMP-acid ligase II